MLSKELEILKHISELYKADVTDEDFIIEMQGKETMINAWRDAFEGYLLRDVLDAIDEYFAKKNNRTPPRIPQIKAVLNSNKIFDERDVYQEKMEAVEPSFGLKFEKLDKENGDMHWFVPDYIEVENLIRANYWGFVYNIYNPTIDEFHRCIEEWCKAKTGHRYRFYSDNDIKNMTDEQKDALLKKCQAIMDKFPLKVIN